MLSALDFTAGRFCLIQPPAAIFPVPTFHAVALYRKVNTEYNRLPAYTLVNARLTWHSSN